MEMIWHKAVSQDIESLRFSCFEQKANQMTYYVSFFKIDITILCQYG